MRLPGIASLLAAAWLLPAAAQAEGTDHVFYDATGKFAGVYLCVPEVSSGIRFDEASKRWTHGQFITEGKSLIFKVVAAGTEEIAVNDGRMRMTSYTVTVSTPGQPGANRCLPREGDMPVRIFRNGLAICTTGLLDYKLNIGPMRFMEVYQHGYIDGADEPGNHLGHRRQVQPHLRERKEGMFHEALDRDGRSPTDYCPACGGAQTQMWVPSDTANRRTCPSTECGSVGTLFFRESARVHESMNGWSRVSKYYDASCSGGRTGYVDSGRADCDAANGIKNGQFAEWVRSDLLTAQRPADPAAVASGTAKLIGQSDDFRRYEAEFVTATDALLASGQCKAADFKEWGGWMKSSNKGAGIYFSYCRGGSDRIYLDVSSGRVFRRTGAAR